MACGINLWTGSRRAGSQSDAAAEARASPHLTRHRTVSKKRNQVQNEDCFGLAGRNSKQAGIRLSRIIAEVADVAIVAVGGRRISVFLINARARVGVVNARFGVARSAGDGNHSANFTAGINSRECIGQYARAYPTILVSGGGVRATKGVYLGGYKY